MIKFNYSGDAGEGRDVVWSGEGPIPEIGDKVKVTLNKLGTGEVTGHFLADGDDVLYIGLRVKFDDPPEWYVKQNGKDHAGHVFGAETKFPLELAAKAAAYYSRSNVVDAVQRLDDAGLGASEVRAVISELRSIRHQKYSAVSFERAMPLRQLDDISDGTSVLVDAAQLRAWSALAEKLNEVD